MTDDRKNWRKAFEMIGPETLRLRLEHRRNEYQVDYGREAELWLIEKDAEAAAIERCFCSLCVFERRKLAEAGSIEVRELAGLDAALIDDKGARFPRSQPLFKPRPSRCPPNDGLVLFSRPLNLAVDDLVRCREGFGWRAMADFKAAWEREPRDP